MFRLTLLGLDTKKKNFDLKVLLFIFFFIFFKTDKFFKILMEITTLIQFRKENPKCFFFAL